MQTRRLHLDRWKTDFGGVVDRQRRIKSASLWYWNGRLIGEGGKARRRAFRLMRSAAASK